jgi:hypothetical protein
MGRRRCGQFDYFVEARDRFVQPTLGGQRIAEAKVCRAVPGTKSHGCRKETKRLVALLRPQSIQIPGELEIDVVIIGILLLRRSEKGHPFLGPQKLCYER